MAKDVSVAVVEGEKLGFIARLKEFYHEVLLEMSKVAWPTPEQVKAETTIVFYLIAILAGTIAFLDMFFKNIVILAFKIF